MSSDLLDPSADYGASLKSKTPPKISVGSLKIKANSIKVSSSAGPASGQSNSKSGAGNVGARVQMMREKTARRANWNLYVGDLRYKTNFWLSFAIKSTNFAFENTKLSTSLYSIRCICLLLACL